MKDSIKVFAPATIANVGPGYDLMGFALDDIGEQINVKKKESNFLAIKPIAGFPEIPTEPEKNVATVAVKAMLNHLSIQQGFEFEFIKNIKPGSGLGTSASSSAGAVFAVNELLDKPYSTKELVQFAAEGEKYLSGKAHADNVAPSLLGGFQLVRSNDPWDVVSLKYPKDIYVTIVHPQIEIQTSEARKIISDKVPLENAIKQTGNLAALVAGLHTNDLSLIGRSMEDVLAEPVRSVLIPKYHEVKKSALKAGAFGCSIAGSGPSIFALSNEQKIAKDLTGIAEKIYKGTNIETVIYVSKIGAEGVRVVD